MSFGRLTTITGIALTCPATKPVLFRRAPFLPHVNYDAIRRLAGY